LASRTNKKTGQRHKENATIHGQHHPTADTDHLYLPRKGEGIKLVQIEGPYKAEVMKLMGNVESKKEDTPASHKIKTTSNS
jgi:hypothetical protein